MCLGIAALSCTSTPPSAAGRSDPLPSTLVAGQPAPELVAHASDGGAQSPLLARPTSPESSRTPEADVCHATSIEAEQVPVDVFMMIDQSISMLDPDISGGTRWGGIVDALTQFVQAPESSGLGVGLQYFGLGLAGVSCSPDDYAVAEIEIGALPENAQAIVTSIGQHIPSSVTPTPPALQGALMHAAAYKMQHATHAVVVLLVTDGEPDFCGLIDDTISAAQAGVHALPSVQTYVLGVGAALDALNQIAQAGGSEHAYIVDGTQAVSDQVLQALEQIRNRVALPCELIAPHDPGTAFDPSQVNLTYTPSGGTEMVLSYSADLAKSDSAALAWHYDNPDAPQKLVLGANTCKAITSGGGKIRVSLECPTVELK
jgi:hypothetical protein